MRDGGKHAGPIFQETAQPRLHPVERPRSLPHLDCSRFHQRGHVQITAEPLGCSRK